MTKHASTTQLKLAAVAAAVGLALGGTALAQQSQNQRQPQAQQSSQSQSQSQGSQARQGDNGGKQEFDDLAQEHSNLSTFVHAIEAAGLEDSLTSGTDYTVFAPSNEAFQSMSGKSTDELMKPENRDELVSLLRAHIVADDVDPQLAKQLDKAETIDGGTVSLDNKNGNLMVGDAKVTDAQGIELTNNVRIYPIDHVLAANGTARTSQKPDQANRQQAARSTPQRG